MSDNRTQDPLHGVTLKTIVTELMEQYGWEELGKLININCFTSNPSINSSLKFLRKTPWARQKVEELYLRMQWTNTINAPTNNNPPQS
ncbi:MAG: DNA-binding protein VF530 [Methylococcaceae bacterium]|nr:DNA-binding protein VF530 [Methylococcaceae bacterium]